MISKNQIQKLVLFTMSCGRYPDFVLMFIISIVHIKKINRILLRKVLFIFLGSFFIILWNDYPYSKFVQQAILLLVSILGYDVFMRKYVNSIQSLFLQYLSFTYLLSFVAVIQYLIFQSYGIDVFLFTTTNGDPSRAHAWLTEAGWYASFLTPSVAYTFFNIEYLKDNKKKSLLLLISYLLTFSTLGYFSLAVVAFLWIYSKNRVRKKIIATSMAIVALVLVTSIDLEEQNGATVNGGQETVIMVKFAQTVVSLNSLEPSTFELLNLSSYATLSNLWVAFNAPTRLIGTGLGTHEVSYEKLYRSDYVAYGLNKEDAYSLFTRVFSEFGIIGIIMLLGFLKRYYNKDCNINKSILVYILAMGIRGGLYTMYGVVMFMFMYYYTSKQYERKREIINNHHRNI